MSWSLTMSPTDSKSLTDSKPHLGDSVPAETPAVEPRLSPNGPVREPPGRNPESAFVFGEVHPYSTNIDRAEVAWGAAALATWITVFAAGLLVPAFKMMGPFWEKSFPSPELAGWYVLYGLLAIVSFAGTNVLFLSCAAAVLGCMARRWQISDELRTVKDDTRLAPSARVYFSAILRGFFLYLLIVGGSILVLSEDALSKMEFGQYWRIAGVISVMAFVMGYNPNLLVRLVQRVVEAMPDAGQTAEPRTEKAAPKRETNPEAEKYLAAERGEPINGPESNINKKKRR